MSRALAQQPRELLVLGAPAAQVKVAQVHEGEGPHPGRKAGMRQGELLGPEFAKRDHRPSVQTQLVAHCVRPEHYRPKGAAHARAAAKMDFDLRGTC